MLAKISLFFFLTLTLKSQGGVKSKIIPLNLHEIDSNKQTGFGLYRMGVPDKKDIKRICDLGIREVYVLSGDANVAEYKYRDVCPGLKVVYNKNQDSKVPLNMTFLEEFDRWVEEAKLLGKKIAFRCECGCHRTGRLAAYYQMKFRNYTPEKAIKEMWNLGHLMFMYKHLKPQTVALFDHIKGTTCTQEPKYCVGNYFRFPE